MVGCHDPDNLFLSVCIKVIAVVLVMMVLVLATVVGVMTSSEAVINRTECNQIM